MTETPLLVAEIRQLRHDLGQHGKPMSAERLSRLFGVTRNTLELWEQGRMPRNAAWVMARIVEIRKEYKI